MLHIKVHAANIHDTTVGGQVFEEALQKYPSLKGVCADAGYRKTAEEFIKNILKKTIDISKRIAPGWALLSKRWIVERTFAWFNHYRRLSKDYEITVKSAETFLMLALKSIVRREWISL